MQTCICLPKRVGGEDLKILASENPETQEIVSSVIHDHQPGLLFSGEGTDFTTLNSIQISIEQ